MEKRIPLKKEVHDKLADQAKAEGKTADEKVVDIVLEKAAPTPVAEPTTAKPTETAKKRRGKSGEKKSEPVEQNNGKQPFVNAYGFVHLNSKLMAVVGAEKGKKTPIVIDVQGNTLVIRKA